MTPHPTIKECTAINMEPEDREAAERLIEKHILPKVQFKPAHKDQELAPLIQTFRREHTNFKNKIGYFLKNTIWLSAEDEKIPSHVLIRTTFPCAKLYGMLVYLFCSKRSGICEAERTSKDFKMNKTGQ